MRWSDVGASLRRHWVVPVIMLVLTPMVMAVYLVNRDVVRPPARYTTSADVLIPARDEETDESPDNIPPVLLQGQTELALARSTTDLVLQNADLEDASDERIGFDARLSPEGSIMTLSVSAPKPELAARLLDEYITVYQDGRRQSVLDAALDLQEIELRVIGILTAQLAEVEADIRELELPFPPRVPDGEAVATPPGASTEGVLLLYERNALLNEKVRRQVDYSLQTTQAAIPGDFSTVVQTRSAARITPPPPSPLIPLLGLLFGGLLLAIAVPVLMDRFDSTITEPRAAPRTLRAGLLGTIPFMPRRLHHQFAPRGSTWEGAFRALAATSISTDRLPKAIMVTGPTGSTQDSVAANFAASLARLGATVALIGTVPRQDWFLDEAEPDIEDDEDDAGDERPAATQPAQPPPGASVDPAPPTFPELLADAQAGRLTGDLRTSLGTRDVANLFIVPPGDDEIELSLDGLPPLLDALARSEIDITVIAGPALLEDPNATIIASSTRHVLWTIEIGRVNTRDAQLAADRIELAGVAPFGVVLVNRHALDRA